MNRKGQSELITTIIIVLFVSIVISVAIHFLPLSSEETKPIDTVSNQSIRIANWNLQIFGDSKASNQTKVNFYVSKMSKYDIIFIQEIRDSDGSAFEILCDAMEEKGYKCLESSPAGRSSSKEQYGLFWNQKIRVNSIYDYNPDSRDRWERPPIRVEFILPNEMHIFVYNIHVKPDDVKDEMFLLDKEMYVNDYIKMTLGDFNADCSYFDRSENQIIFSDYEWIIKDSDDTTVSQTSCAYDRILLDENLKNYYVTYGIDSEGITKDISDHYLIWIEVNG